jgi:TRAP-type C4-dicarboxylate transport system permease small subunit
MRKALGLFINLALKAFGIFVIVAAWFAYLGFWENLGSLSLGYIHENLTLAIALTIGGVAVIAFSSSIARFIERR